MPKIPFDPFDYNGKVRIEVLKIDNQKIEDLDNPSETKKKLYGDNSSSLTPNDYGEITTIDTREIEWSSIELSIKANIKDTAQLQYAIIRFDSHWTQWSDTLNIEKSVENNTAMFSQNYVLHKRNISSQVLLKAYFYSSRDELLDMSPEFFLQSDGRDGPDISKGLFNVKVEDFTNIKEKDGWIKYVKELGGTNQSIAVDVPVDDKITIFYNKSFGGFENLKIEGSNLEKSVTTLQNLYIGIAPFLIECIRTSHYLYDLEIQFQEEVNTDGDTDKTVRDSQNKIKNEHKKDLLNFVRKALKKEDDFIRVKTEMIANLLYENDNNVRKSLFNFLEDSHKDNFDQLTSRAIVAYQSKFFRPNPSKTISNNLDQVKTVLRTYNTQNTQDTN